MGDPAIISVRGAREHNLKSIDVDIPRNQLVVVTGLSGSGKSSLAMDTIYAEGQRRYVESLSTYARQFLNMMEKPDVDHISGLSPAISIEQKTTSVNPRSTVGTVTEIYDYLRLLYARAGTPYSPATGQPIMAQQVSDMVRRILDMESGTRVTLLSPVIRDRKGEFQKELLGFRKQGFLRARIDGEFHELDEPPSLKKTFRHNIDLVVDRVVASRDIGQRLADSLRTALDQSGGIAVAEYAGPKEGEGAITFSENFACPVSGFTIPDLEPRLFSFNVPSGACPKCDGLGQQAFFDERLVVPDHDCSVLQNAIHPWNLYPGSYQMQTVVCLAHHYDVNIGREWKRLPASFQQVLLHGSGEEEIEFEYVDHNRSYNVTRRFEGILPNLERRYRETGSPAVRSQLERYRNSRPCPDCGGYRLRMEALSVRVGDLNIGQLTEMSVGDAHRWIGEVGEQLGTQNRQVAGPILRELHDRLGFLVNVGLDYLTLSRQASTLSGGESQRIRLASQIGSGLTGVLYVLDEPSIGLHQRDNRRLLDTLRNLRDQGNTVIVVEHDEEAIREADTVIDFGPRAGVNGGRIVAQGTPADIEQNPSSLTGQYLCRKKVIPYRSRRRTGHGRSIRINSAFGNNLKNVTVDFPLGKFICVTGVSGSGKSTLTFDTLYRHVKAAARGWGDTGPANCGGIEGAENIDSIINIDQRPIGRTPRSNPATYTDSFTPIRNWFVELPESRARGYKPGQFSFNVKGGRCEACQGDGVKRIEMHFLSDVFVTCESCGGKRYNQETLEIRFRGKNIADVLSMTVDEAVEFFSAIPTVSNRLLYMQKVGLGYIRLGQQATTLSGGEAQRVKLAKELGRRASERALYILDEPTTGLHFEDIRNLLTVLHEFANRGNTVVVIEHNLDVIKTADWVIDLGPEGGDGGGQVVATGTPEQICLDQQSHTGRYLKPLLDQIGTEAA